MTKRMLIDATHAEETRIVVLDGNRLEDFDVESASRKQLKGNIYLAKVVRVEPSLQAAFVEYGGGRHGFLAFGEIHPDYYQIPVADRQRLLALQAEEARAEAEAEDDADVTDVREPAATHAEVEAAADADIEAIAEPPTEAPGDTPVAHAALEPPADLTPDFAPDLAPEFAPPEFRPEADHASPPPAEHAPIEAAHIAEAVGEAPIDIQVETRGEVLAETPADTPPETSPETSPETPAATSPEIPSEASEIPDGAPRPAQPAAIPREERFGPADTELGELPSESLEISAAETTLEDPPGEADAAPDVIHEAAPDEVPHHVPAERNDEPRGFGPVEVTEFAPPPETIGGEPEQVDGAEDARRRRESRLLRSYRIQEVIKRRQIMLVQVVKEERGTKGAALTTYISLAGRFSVLMPNSPRGGGISRKITSAADRRRLKEITAELDLPAGMGLIVRTAGANRPKPEIKRDCEYLMRLWDDIREHTLRSVAPALIYEEASLIKRAIRDVYSRDIEEIIVDGEQGWRAAHDFMRMLMPSHAKKVQLWRGEQPLFAKHQVEAQLDAMLVPTVQLKSGGYLVINQTEALVAIDVNSGRSTRERNIEETALRTNLEAADEAARQLRLRDLAGLIVIDFIDMESRKHNAAVERRLKDALKNDRARIQVGSISHFGLLEMSRQRLRPSLAETSFVTCPHCAGTGHVRSTESAAIHVLREIEDEAARGRASVIMVHAASAVVMFLLNHKRDRLHEIELRSGMRAQFTVDDQLVPPQCRIDRVRARVEGEKPLLPAPVAPVAPPDLVAEEEDSEDETAIAEAADASADGPVGGDGGAETNESAEEAGRRRRRRRRRGGRREAEAGSPAATAEDDASDEAAGATLAPLADVPAADTSVETSRQDAAPTMIPAAVATDPDARADTPLASDEAVGPAPDTVDQAQAEQPAQAAEEAGEDEARGRRRGRRGGRRRRRDQDDASEANATGPDADAGPEASPEASPEAGPGADLDTVAQTGTATTGREVVARYTGPTPANPYGGVADIFDFLDFDPPAPPSPAPAPAAPPAAPAAQAPVALEPAPPLAPEPAPTPAPEPAPEATPIAAEEPSRPDPEPAPAQPEGPVVGTPIAPVVIGNGESGAAPRRGWWRR